MFVRKPSGSGRGLVPTTGSRTPRQAALLIAALVLATLGLIAAIPQASHSASFQAIQASINSKQAAIDQARAKEGVLTGDISALSKRIRGLTREIGSLRRREARVQNTLDARRSQLARVQARYQVEHDRFVRLRRELRRVQGVLAKRLVEIYKADQPDMMSVILESDGFSDLLVRADYMKLIGQQD